MRRSSTAPLPGDELNDGRVALITNWSTFALKQGASFDNCELVILPNVARGRRVSRLLCHLPTSAREARRVLSRVWSLRNRGRIARKLFGWISRGLVATLCY